MLRLSVVGAVVFVGASVSAFGSTAAVLVSGTGGAICEVGNCVTPDTVSTNVTTNFDLVYTLANGDEYRIVGSFEAFDNGSTFGFATPYNVVYLGPGGPSGTDTLTIDVLQNFTFGGGTCCGADLIVTFGSGLGAGTSDFRPDLF